MRVSGPLRLRSWRAGDRLGRPGGTGPQKIKTLFHLARIPIWDRAGWPVLTDGASVIWTRRFGVSAEVAASEATRVVLRVREVEASEEIRIGLGQGGV